MRRLAALLVLLMSLAPAWALEPQELLKDPALEARARALSAQLRCLVCQNQSIDDSDAPLAHDLRSLIREHLVKGESDDQIMSYVVDRYGEFVLLKPPLSAHTLLLWGTPFAVLALAAGLLLSRRRPQNSVPEQPLTEAEREALRKALE
jgi:cytochrome c-type biogenesis protein CcmH